MLTVMQKSVIIGKYRQHSQAQQLQLKLRNSWLKY